MYAKGNIAFEIVLVTVEVQLPRASGGGRHPQASEQSGLQVTGKQSLMNSPISALLPSMLKSNLSLANFFCTEQGQESSHSLLPKLSCQDGDI